ncbi:MAG: metal ABC transporter permease [bacterium]|nr:metal ABC transporter permease [bacterium]
MEISLSQSFLIALAVGLASGSVGAFVVLRRMALVGDALSHVALPGIALALAYEFDPFWGVAVSLIGAAFVVFWLETKTKLPSEALVGLLFTASLAVGILTIPDEEIIHSLFGEFPLMPAYLLMLIVATALIATAFVFFSTRRFAFRIIAPELAEASGVKQTNNLLFLIVFAIVVALGIKLVGTLLMGALTIIPAAIARNVTRGMKAYIVISAVLGMAIAALGVLVAHSFGLLPGPSIILLGTSLFIVSLFWSVKV